MVIAIGDLVAVRVSIIDLVFVEWPRQFDTGRIPPFIHAHRAVWGKVSEEALHSEPPPSPP